LIIIKLPPRYICICCMLSAVLANYKNAYSGLSRSTWLLSVVMLINRSGTMVVPFLTLYLIRTMGYSVSQAGFVFAFFGLGAFTGAYVGGKFTDKIGFYEVQIITLLGGGIMFFVLSAMKTYLLICLFTYLLAFINEAFRPANSAAIAFYSNPDNRTRSYALNRLAINIGWALGSSIGGVLAGINYKLLFYVDGVTNITAAILIWIFMKPITIKEEKNAPMVTGVLSAYKDKTYLLFILLTVFFASCFFQLFTNLSPFFAGELHFSEPLIGFLLATNGVIIAIIEMVLVYRLDGKGRNLHYISVGIFMVGLAFLMLNIRGMGPLLAFFIITLMTFGEIFSMPFMNSFWVNRSQAANRGQYAALYTMAWSAAQTLGPLAGSQLAGNFGFKWLWLSVGVICLIVALLVRRLKTGDS